MPSLAETIASWFGGNAQDEYGDNTEGYLRDQGHGDVTSEELQREIPRVLTTLHGGGELPPPPPDEAFDGPDGGGFSPARTLSLYTSHYSNENFQTFNDGDNVVNNEGDSLVDNSVATNIEAFGSDIDFDQDIDNENNLALGEDSIAQSGDGTANTGDDAFVVGQDLNNSGTIAAGPVGGSVTGDIGEDATVVGRDVGDGNVLGSDLDNSAVGNDNTIVAENEDSAIGFGSGNVANDSQILDGDGVLQNDVDGNANAAANTGSGTQNAAVGSDVDRSAIGGDNQANDFDVDADDGAAVSFGSGDARGSNVEVDDVDGNVQVASGDENDQTAVNDESFEDNSINDSFNEVDQSINDSGNLDASDDDLVDIDDQDGADFDNSPIDASDDDVVDVG